MSTRELTNELNGYAKAIRRQFPAWTWQQCQEHVLHYHKGRIANEAKRQIADDEQRNPQGAILTLAKEIGSTVSRESVREAFRLRPDLAALHQRHGRQHSLTETSAALAAEAKRYAKENDVSFKEAVQTLLSKV